MGGGDRAVEGRVLWDSGCVVWAGVGGLEGCGGQEAVRGNMALWGKNVMLVPVSVYQGQ